MSPPPESTAPTRSNSVISAVDLVSIFEHYPVISGASFEVKLGERVLLEGPNGAGKTSILRACSGLLNVTRGSLSVLGIEMNGQPEVLAGMVGFLGHENGLYRDLTVVENLKFFGRVMKSPGSLEDALKAVEISTRLGDTRVDRLSAGQKRRTALALLLMTGANLWLLDEPHAGLDSVSRNIIDSVITQSKITVLFASHEKDRAHALATRVLSVRGGRIDDVSAVDEEDVGNLKGFVDVH